MMKPLFSLYVVVLLCVCDSVAFAQDRPHILVILLDDAGWTDLGCYGSRIDTPEMDRLAAQGMRFTDCHSAAPNCSPSRAGLLTGRTPTRCGIYSYLPTAHVMHLREEEVTVAELLKDEGYATGHFGKWHLSQLQSNQPGPADQGFDYSLGTDNNAEPSHLNPTNFVRNGIAVGPMKGYSCQIVVDEASRWLESVCAKDQSFFACVWFHEPHTPIASPPDLTEKYKRRFPELTRKQAEYHANIENVDRAVGRLMATLQSLGVAQDTLVFLTSDNGPLHRFSRKGLRGRKSNVWEGGHRVPGIFRWPGRIAAGTECARPISGVDFLPTVCDVLGVRPPADRVIDGTSVLPLLVGDDASFQRQKPLYWFFYRLNPAIALRTGPWTLIAKTNDAQRPKAHPLVREDMSYIRDSEPVDFQLFHVGRDLRQQQNVIDTQPALSEQLQASMREIHHDAVAEGHQWEIPTAYGKDSQRKRWESEPAGAE